jgi:hypothetical protein
MNEHPRRLSYSEQVFVLIKYLYWIVEVYVFSSTRRHGRVILPHLLILLDKITLWWYK